MLNTNFVMFINEPRGANILASFAFIAEILHDYIQVGQIYGQI
jgi:hypothetical protein